MKSVYCSIIHWQNIICAGVICAGGGDKLKDITITKIKIVEVIWLNITKFSILTWKPKSCFVYIAPREYLFINLHSFELTVHGNFLFLGLAQQHICTQKLENLSFLFDT